MGENTTIQQEPVYLTYGGSQIEQQPLFDALANNVQAYISEQPWSKKKKERFMSAYSDILSKGIVGANNTSGEWALDLGQVLDLDSLPKKDKEMYHEAAYYILEQMKGIPTVENKKEEDKKNLQLYTNDLHNKAIVGYIGNHLFGGQNWDYTTDWDVLDKRDEKTGILSTSGRMAKLADVLEGYSNSLEEGKYNFEGTAFKDLNDLKTRLNAAATALRSGVMDQNVINSLNMAGINWREYLHDGSEETVTLQDGTTMTRGEYNKAKAEQEAAIAEKEASEKAAAEQQRALALKQANAGVLDLVGGIRAVEARSAAPAYAQYLAKTYGVGRQGFNEINTAVQGLLEKGRNNQLTTREKKQLGNLLYYIRTNNPNYNKSNISDFEWQELNKYHNLQSKNRNGFVRLPWQTSDGRYTFADDKGNVYFLKPQNQQKLGNIKINRNNINNYRNNFLMNTPQGIDKKQADYLKSVGFNNADIAELSGIALDIASIVDPEPISAGVMGVAAAGARNYARAQDPKDWTFGDYATQAFDYLTGAVGAIPGLGDAALAYKTVKGVAKWGKRALTIPAVYDMLSHTPGALQAVQKAVNGEDLTVQDWKNLGSFFRGLTATRNITVQNRAQRRALEKRGFDLSDQNSWLKKSGLWDTSTPKGQTTLKVNAKGEQQEIVISPESKAKLDKDLKKAGNNQTKKDEIIREVKEIKEYTTKNNLKPEDVKAIESSRFRNARFVPRQLGTTKDNYGRNNISRPKGEDTFESYLKSDRGLWDRFKYGSNRTLRAFDPLRGTNVKVNPQESSKENKPLLGLPLLKTKKPYTSPSSESVTTVNSIAPLKPYETPIKLNKDLPKNYGKVNLEEREIIESFQHSYGLGGLKDTQMYKGFGGSAIKAGTIEIGPLKFTLSRAQAKEIRNNPGKISEFRGNIARQVQKAIDQKKIKSPQAAELILKLKKKGFLKQGGQLNYSMEDKITNFLKTKI